MAKVCRNCLVLKNESEYAEVSNYNRTPRMECKPCRSAIGMRMLLEKKLVKFPYTYVECDECDHIFRITHNSCIKCGSRNLNQYLDLEVVHNGND